MGHGMSEIPKSWMIGAGIGAVVLLALYLAGRKTGQAIAKGIDITSSDNIAATAVDKVGQAVSSNPGWSLGVFAWELTNPEAAASAKVGSGPQFAYGSKKKPATAPKKAAPKQGPTQGGSWSVVAPTSADDRPPSVLNPGQGGTGGSFEQMSSPWSF
jgi:hypothetical protein